MGRERVKQDKRLTEGETYEKILVPTGCVLILEECDHKECPVEKHYFMTGDSLQPCSK